MIKNTIERSKERYYQFVPYNNRRDGKPGWQWDFLCNAFNWGRVAYGGNRIGKSDIGAFECVLAVTGEHPFRKYPAKGKGWVIGKTLKITTEVDLVKFESLLPNAYKTKFDKQKSIWYCCNEEAGREWEVHFRTAEAGRAAFQADAIDFAWFDEEPAPTKQDVWKEVTRGLTDRKGIWWMTATPIYGTVWLKNLIESDPVVSFTGASWDNPYVPLEELERWASTMTEDEVEVRLEGKYVVFGGKPVFNVRNLNSMLEIVRLDKQADYGRLQEVA